MDEINTNNNQGWEESPALRGNILDNQPTRKDFLPFCRPLLGKEEEDAVLNVLRSGWLTTGARTLQFEKDFAEFKGCKHTVAVSSCTAALHLALVARGIGDGDEVITTPITWPSTINSIVHQRAKPVFVDVELGTLNIDVNEIEEKITKRTKAILPVHLAGHPCDMDEINDIADKYGLYVIEDSAHALEAEYKGRKTGIIGNVGCFSFYPTKNITTGEGGMLTINDGRIAELARTYSFNGIDRDAWKRYGSEGYKHWEVIYPGYKYNMPDILATIGICQLKKVEEFWEVRKRYTEMYDEAFKEIPEVRPLERKSYIRHSYHLYVVVVDTDRLTVDRDVVMNAIQAENVGIGIHFRAMHLQEGYRKLYGHKRGDYPNAEYASDRIISLPLYPAMTVQDVRDVIDVVKKVTTKYRK